MSVPLAVLVAVLLFIDVVPGHAVSRCSVPCTGADAPVVTNPGNQSSAITESYGYAGAVAAAHPVGYWRLEGEGTSTAADWAATPHAGTLSGGVTRGLAGALSDGSLAMHFDGQADTHIEIADGSAFDSNALSVEAWVKPASTAANGAIVDRLTSSGRAFVLMQESGSWVFRANGSFGWTQVITPVTSADVAAWTHLVATFDGTTLKLFKNGLTASTNVPGPVTFSTGGGVLRIGELGSGGYPFDGAIDEVAVYPQALTAGQVAGHYGLRATASSVALQIAAADPEGDALTYGAAGLPPGLLINPFTGLITGNPIQAGAFTVSVTATDPGGLVGTETFIWTITSTPAVNPNRPVVTNPGSQSNAVTENDGYPGGVTAAQPLAYWRLDDYGTTAADWAPTPHAGTVTGGVLRAQPGALADGSLAMTFDGQAGSHIEIPQAAAFDSTGALTVEAWVRPVDAAANGAIFDRLTNNGRAYVLMQESGNWVFRLYGSLDWTQATSPVAAEDEGRWIHFVATFDGTTVRLFKNGLLVSSNVTGLGMLNAGGGTTRIGELGSGGYPFQGAIDEVAVYMAVLSPEQITAHYGLRSALSSVSLQLAATDLNGDALTYTATGLPPGLVLNPGTGLVTGHPTQVGAFTVAVAATDPVGLTGSDTFAWAITPAGSGPSCGSLTTLSTSGISTSSAARADSFAIAAPGDCSWNVTTPSWITVSPVSGEGHATVALQISANTTGTARTGSIAAGGQTIIVTQAGEGCAATLSPSTINAPASGASGNILATVPWGCGMAPTSDAPWIHLNGGPAGYQRVIGQDFPAGYWRLGDRDTDVAADQSGHGFSGVYNGTLTRGVAASVADGDAAVAFDGGYVRVPYQGGLDPRFGSFSLEAWVRVTAPVSGIVAGSYAVYDGNYPYGYALRLVDGHAQFRGDDLDTVVTVDSSRLLTDGVWHHLVATVDGPSGAVALFVDATLEGTGTTPELFVAGDFGIAGASDGASDPLSASIDEVAFYTQALPSEQVQAHFAAQHDPLTAGPQDMTVPYTIDANPLGARSGAITLGDQTVSVTQAADRCVAAATLSPSSISAPALGASGSIQVTTAWGCATVPSTTAAWIHFGSAAGYESAIGQDQPSGYWRLDDLNTDVAADRGGQGLAGTYNGTYTQGVASPIANGDPAASFDGGYIRVPYQPALDPNGGSFSLEAWVRVSAPISGIVAGSYTVYDGEYPYGYAIRLAAGHAQFRGDDLDTIVTVDSSRLLTDGAWHHLVATLAESGEVKLFVDGVLEGTAATPEPFWSADFGIGGAFDGSRDLVSASIDEVAIYGQALSLQQVQAHYAAQHDSLAGAGLQESSVSYTIDANPSAFVRDAAMTLSGQTLAVTQAAATCGAVSASPQALFLPYGPVSGPLAVATINGCSWTASTDTPWITLSDRLDGYGGQVALDAPIAYWRLNETTGTTAADASGHGYTGTYQFEDPASLAMGAPGAAGSDAAVEFVDGTARLNAAAIHTAAADGPFSVEAWIKVSSGSGGYIAMYGNYLLQLSGDHLLFRALGSESDQYRITGARVVNNGVWHHVVVAIDPAGGSARLFVDGTLDATRTITASYASWDPTFGIVPVIGAGVTGTIDEVALYESALTTARVGAHYSGWVADGGGPGRVVYTASANPAITTRSGEIHVSDVTVPVTQAGAPCISVSPGSVSAAAAGESGTFEVTALDTGCAWTTSTPASWITFDVSSGTGSSQVHFTILGNQTPFRRATTVTIAGVVLIVQQGALGPQRPGLNYSIAAGLGHTLALGNDGTVWSWGSNSFGQLGDGTRTPHPSPAQVPSLSGVVAIAAGQSHSLALKDDGTVWAWGWNIHGELGDGSTLARNSPVQVTGLSDVVAISAGLNHSVALKADGTVWTWGRNEFGQLGIGAQSTQATTSPQPVALNTPGVAIAAGGEVTEVLEADGTVWWFGGFRFTIPNLGTFTNPGPSPGQLTSLPANITGVGAGDFHMLALTSNGLMFGWGWNVSGQLGTGTTDDGFDVVSTAASMAPYGMVRGGDLHTIALKADGTIAAWGANSAGEIGDGTTTNRLAPVAVSGPDSVTAIAARGKSSAAISSDGRVWSWGDNALLPVQLSDAGLVWRTPAPVFNVASGEYFSTLTVTATTPDPNAVIRYTIDGSEPTEISPPFPLDGLDVLQSTTVRAKAWSTTGGPSAVVTAAYALKVLSPTVTPWSGDIFNESQQVTVTADAGVLVLYTTDGTDPVAGAPNTQAYTTPMPVGTLTRFKFVGTKPGWTPSDVTDVTYQFNYGVLAPPTISPSSGGVYGDQVTVSAAAFAQIRYTTDGSVPTVTSALYTGPFTLTAALRLTAAAFSPEWMTSAIVTAVLTPKAAAPSFSPGAGAYGPDQRITITDSMPGATIRYTNNGQDPGVYDPIVPTGGTVPIGNYTLKARAFGNGLLPSDLTSAAYSRTDDGCTYTMSPLVVSAGPAATGGILSVAASAGSCAWTTSADSPWIDVTPASGSGLTGQVVYHLAPNSSPALRTGLITIGSTNVLVVQAGTGSCTYDVTPGAVATTAAAATGQLAVVTGDMSCGWTAASDVPWVTIGTTNASAYGQAVVADHPIGYWRLSDAAGAASTADASGFGHPGAPSGGVTFGRTGALADGSTSAGFAGISGMVEIPHAAAFDLPAITWEAWVNAPSVSGAPRAILNKGGSTGVYALRIPAEATQLTLDFTLAGGAPQSATLTPTVVGAGWVHVAFTYDGATWRAYLNGAETDSGAAAGTLATNIDPIVFGRDGTLPLDWYDARLSDVAVYPYALSADQLANHFAQRMVAASGGGQVSYEIEGNATGATRTGSLTIAGVVVPVSQASTDGVAIVGSASPSPNAAGWNTSDVTVSFICAGAGTLTCPSPVVVSQDGEQDIPGQVSNDSGATASTIVHVKVDKTAPFVSISSPTRGQLVDAGPITITGTVTDSLSGVSGVACGGHVATVLDSSFSCTVTVPAGMSTVTVSATDLATNLRTIVLEISTADVIDSVPPTSLRVSPQQVTMLVGNTRAFAVVDDRGRIPSGVMWSVDNATVATVTEGPPMALTAVSVGEVILTAAWHGLTATTHVTVRALSVGTSEVITLWSAPSVLGPVKRIVRGASRADGPGLVYTWESTGDATDVIRAFQQDGREAWSAAAGGNVVQLSGDPGGGVVALVDDQTNNIQRMSIFGANGGVSHGPVGTGQFAIHPAGPLYYVSGQQLLSLDIGLGGGRSATLSGRPGTPTVLADGSVVVPSVTSGNTFELAFLQPDGSTLTQSVNVGERGLSGLEWVYRAIPNGKGGLLVQLMTSRPSSEGTRYDALVAGVDQDGNYTGGTSLGKDWGDIVVGEHSAIATSYVWYATQPSNGGQRQHLGMTQGLTLEGNQIGSPDFLPPTGPCAWWFDGIEWSYGGDCGRPVVDVTSVVALGNGGFITGLSDGHLSGADPLFEEMSLSYLQPSGGGTYLGGGPVGLMQLSIAARSTSLMSPLSSTPAETAPASSAMAYSWPTGGGGDGWANAAKPSYKTQDLAALAALREFLPISNRSNQEFGGSICKVGVARFTPSDPAQGDCGEVIPSECTSGIHAGEYHTHVCTFAQDGPGTGDLHRSYLQNAPGYLAANVDVSVRPIDCAPLGQGNVWKWVLDTSVPWNPLNPVFLFPREVIACLPVK
jgi:Concanavalin A-like lectin/glucanases superfamily/Regulator of chromosome condensation (RCC1) repeat/Chitobiase/beta-hexosaminidase C-terminal domain/Putative Ig domain/Glucodextranase, domain B/Putative binding domain, N-terminal/Viral BACON domain